MPFYGYSDGVKPEGKKNYTHTLQICNAFKLKRRTTMSKSELLKLLELALSNVAGVTVEVTLRGPKAFTVSYNLTHSGAIPGRKICDFFRNSNRMVSCEIETELNTCFVYVDIKD